MTPPPAANITERAPISQSTTYVHISGRITAAMQVLYVKYDTVTVQYNYSTGVCFDCCGCGEIAHNDTVSGCSL